MRCRAQNNQEANVRYGVAFFERPNSYDPSDSLVAKGGVASIAGEGAFEFANTTQLPNGVKWLTDLQWRDFCFNQLSSHPGFVFDGYLNTRSHEVLEEIGATSEFVSRDDAAGTLAGIFQRVMSYCESTYSMAIDRFGATLQSDIAATWPQSQSVIDSLLEYACSNANQSVNQVIGQPKPGWQTVTLRRNRFVHAIDVLSTPVPGPENWEYLDSSQLPGRTDHLDWCITNKRPILADVEVKPKSGILAQVLSFGSGARQIRNWVCQPELQLLAKCADVKIRGVWVFNGQLQKQPELVRFPGLGNDFCVVSTSMELLAENFWIAMATPAKKANIVHRQTLPKHCWYRAADRIFMFSRVCKLAQAGFAIVSYGTGAATIKYPHGALSELLDIVHNQTDLNVPIGAQFRAKNEDHLKLSESRR
jgi:hypothetical protein